MRPGPLSFTSGREQRESNSKNESIKTQRPALCTHEMHAHKRYTPKKCMPIRYIGTDSITKSGEDSLANALESL